MTEYFRKRIGSYLFIIIGLLIGFIVSGLTMQQPDYKSGILAVAIGLFIGESLMFLTWMKKGRQTDHIE
ncbi:hypothetical protein [Sporosarcina cascadiensis]|uniref:hypothetical protein n=1 Tax=Sporosarcina cascadiensis TaxID=2660747 RepID=UPI00129B7C11|nr:hypothetical protein [Sporosarcina cascadiensis]